MDFLRLQLHVLLMANWNMLVINFNNTNLKIELFKHEVIIFQWNFYCPSWKPLKDLQRNLKIFKSYRSLNHLCKIFWKDTWSEMEIPSSKYTSRFWYCNRNKIHKQLERKVFKLSVNFTSACVSIIIIENKKRLFLLRSCKNWLNPEIFFKKKTLLNAKRKMS